MPNAPKRYSCRKSANKLVTNNLFLRCYRDNSATADSVNSFRDGFCLSKSRQCRIFSSHFPRCRKTGVFRDRQGVERSLASYGKRPTIPFGCVGQKTPKLQNLSVAVVGCSGTGSPVIEQLARLGVGRLLLVDPDVVKVKNLNRILNTTRIAFLTPHGKMQKNNAIR